MDQMAYAQRAVSMHKSETPASSPLRQAERLSQVGFNDIYLSRQWPATVRGLTPSEAAGRRRVQILPAALREDADRLLDETNRRSKQLGGSREFQIVHDGVPYRAALIAAPARGDRAETGETPHWCLRRLASRAPLLDELGVPKKFLGDMAGLAGQSGLVLIGGTFSSGKSMTAGATLRHWLDNHGEIAVTLEDPVEMPLAGHYDSGGTCYQIEIEEDDFASGIKSARRWAPRYVYIGEIRTPAAAAELLQISIGGPIVITTIQADTPVSALISLTKWASQAIGENLAHQMLSNALRLVATQRLENRRPQIEWMTVSGRDGFGIRSKIRNGNLAHLHDDLEVQKARRANGHG